MNSFWGCREEGEVRKSVIAGGGVRITSIKITDQISIELKQTRTREGHYIMYCVDFFFHTSYCVTQGLTSMYLCVSVC